MTLQVIYSGLEGFEFKSEQEYLGWCPTTCSRVEIAITFSSIARFYKFLEELYAYN